MYPTPNIPRGVFISAAVVAACLGLAIICVLWAVLAHGQPAPPPPQGNCEADLNATSEYAAQLRDARDLTEKQLAVSRSAERKAVTRVQALEAELAKLRPAPAK